MGWYRVSSLKLEIMESRLSMGINRFLHIAFVLLGVYYWTLAEDAGSALANLGIALAFDPFNAEQPLPCRPWWQKIWVLTLVIATLCGLVVLLIR